ncbi:helix-turn-helix domain-containing protein [Rhizobium puerariae]|uniref:Helix-turn-helix domain-containing protein n=1 Tax=Rhizobium puerariae TaxID=1585791 RepID=A0ABV6ARM8_9HYPH
MKHPSLNPDEIIARMKKAYGFSSERQMAQHLNVAESIFYRWRNRDTIHMELILTAALETKVTVDYLLYGTTANTISVCLSEAELSIFRLLAKQQGLQDGDMIKCALRLYQEVCDHLSNGNSLHFSGETERVALFVGPMLRVLPRPKGFKL